MARKEDLCVSVLTASTLGEIKDTEVEVREANAAIQELAKNPTPGNRYEIAQIMCYSVESVMQTLETWLSSVAEVKNTGLDEKSRFKIQSNSIKAYLQAKGSTTPRSKISTKYIDLDTEEVSARPYINNIELATGKVNFADYIKWAAIEMENQKLLKIEQVLHAAAQGWSTQGAYASGVGIVKSTFDPLLQNYQRLGKVSVIGDIYAISKFNGISGFNGTSNPSDKTQDEIMNNGFIGKYLGADVVKLTNPVTGKMFEPLLNKKWLYLVPGGLNSSLKVINEGPVRTGESNNIDDDSYEICLRQNFGAGVVIADYPTIGAYEDLTA